MLKNTSRFKKLCKSAAAILIGLQLATTSLVPVMAEDISLSDTSKASTYKIADLDVSVTVRTTLSVSHRMLHLTILILTLSVQMT